MKKFIKNRYSKESPQVSTASLPDIVFMLLFFFMVVTVIKKETPLINLDLPETENPSDIDKKKDKLYIYVGKVKNESGDEELKIQIQDRFVALEDVQEMIEQSTIEEATITLEADKTATMGLINDVKTEIRKANRLNLNYKSKIKE